MEIIQNKKTIKITSVLILMVMLIGIITPVFAATGTIKLNKTNMKVKVGSTGNTITVWMNTTGETLYWDGQGKYLGNLSGTSSWLTFDALAVGEQVITVRTKDGTVKATCKVEVTEGSSFSGDGIEEALSAIISTTFTGFTTFINSEETKELGNRIGEIITNIFNSIISALSGLFSNLKDIEFPKGIDLPAETPGGETGEKDNKTVAVTSVSISGETKVKVGEEITLTATVKPSNATNQKVTWKSSNSTYATVNENTGAVKGLEAGAGNKVTITATAANGKSDTHEVSVENTQQGSGGSTGTNGITKTVTQEYINSLSKVNLSGYFGGGKYNLTRFNDSGGAFGVQRSQLIYDNTNKWYTYNGRIAVAAAMKRPSWVRSGYDFRSDIYHFGEYEKLYIKINDIWYEAIVVDVCGVSMNPNEKSGNYYDDGYSTNHSCQVIDIWAKSGFSNKYGVEVAIPK